MKKRKEKRGWIDKNAVGYKKIIKENLFILIDIIYLSLRWYCFKKKEKLYICLFWTVLNTAAWNPSIFELVCKKKSVCSTILEKNMWPEPIIVSDITSRVGHKSRLEPWVLMKGKVFDSVVTTMVEPPLIVYLSLLPDKICCPVLTSHPQPTINVERDGRKAMM